jgi:hypothetical protein
VKRPFSAQLWLYCTLTLALAVWVSGGPPAVLAAEEQAAEKSCAVALPEWAPEEPSEEFLRAVEVLGSLPSEELRAAAAANPEMEAFVTALLEVLWPRAFELFGSLTDQQVEKFLAQREIRLYIPSLPASQKTALDNWIEAAGEVAALAPGVALPADGVPPQERFLALLREEGAAEDLSNVDVGFRTERGAVGLYFWINVSESGTGPIISNDFAKLKAKEAPQSSE